MQKQDPLKFVPCSDCPSGDTGRRAQGKGERLKLQQVFSKKPSFPREFMVTSPLSGISASSHHGGQSTSCLVDQSGGERRKREVLNPRAECF